LNYAFRIWRCGPQSRRSSQDELLLKFLSPSDLKKQEGFARRLAIELIEKLAGRNSCDFKKEVAVVLPVTVFMTMMQWDHSRLYEMIGWVHDVIGSDDPAVRAAAFERMSGFLRGVIQDRIASPGSDPISILLASEVNGQRVTPQRVQEMCYLLFTAGLDTVTNAMTYSMHYLATDPAMQQRLRANPDQIPPRSQTISAASKVGSDSP
jgi:cytochrome P450